MFDIFLHDLLHGQGVLCVNAEQEVDYSASVHLSPPNLLAEMLSSSEGNTLCLTQPMAMPDDEPPRPPR